MSFRDSARRGPGGEPLQNAVMTAPRRIFHAVTHGHIPGGYVVQVAEDDGHSGEKPPDAHNTCPGHTEGTCKYQNPAGSPFIVLPVSELELHIDVKGVADAATLVAVLLATTEEAAEANGGKIALKDALALGLAHRVPAPDPRQRDRLLPDRLSRRGGRRAPAARRPGGGGLHRLNRANCSISYTSFR